MPMRTTLLGAAILALVAGAAAARCADDAAVAAFVDDFSARTPTAALGAAGDMDDALCTQEKLAAALEPVLGPVIGYKVGLTSAPAQERFGVTEPVRGLLYRDMMIGDGAEVPVRFGAVPLFEADLVLVVADAAINDAATPEAVMRHVEAVRPFIELPDLMVAPGEPLTGETITAMGVGVRLGVLGDPLPVDDPAAMTRALGEMTVRMTASDGTVLAEAPGAAVLGHPANAVTWLVSQGVTLAPGDLVSVGSFGPLVPPGEAGGAATVGYAGLPGDPEIRVRFAGE